MTLIRKLNTLESAGLVRLAAAQPELEYLFRHALVQDAAYGSLLKKDRKQLHLAVGEALEQLYAEQRDERAATLAYHFEKAEVRDTFTVVYRGYYIEVSRGCIGWRAGVYPRSADLPILYRNEVQTSDQDEAVIEAMDGSDRWRAQALEGSPRASLLRGHVASQRGSCWSRSQLHTAARGRA